MKMWNPYVRFARMNETFIIQGILQAIDHRIFYCHRGKGQIEANGQLYSFTAGTLIYLPARTPYRYIFNQEIPVFSGCNFDFYQDHADLNTPIPPVAQSHFRTENILEPQVLDGEDIFSQTLCLENVFQFEEKFIEMAQEFEAMAKQYEMDVEKIKSMVPEAELKTSLETKKAIKVIVDSAVAVAPKAKEEKVEE